MKILNFDGHKFKKKENIVAFNILSIKDSKFLECLQNSKEFKLVLTSVNW